MIRSPIMASIPILAAVALLSACSSPAQRRPLARAIPTTAPDPRAPAEVRAPGSATLVAGGSHACAIEAGRVHCWGRMTSVGESGPPFWVPGLEGVEDLAAGSSFACARTRRPGPVVCWGSDVPGAAVPEGYNFYDLPEGSPRERPTHLGHMPVAQAVALGAGHACFLDSGGGVLCWGAT